jgi:phosphoglycolate phosphatase
MQKRKISNIIWDWNGTLLNDMVTCVECMNILLNDRSLPQISGDHYREVFTFPVRDYFLRVGFDFSKEDFKIPAFEFIELYNRKHIEVGLFSEARGTLQQFRDQGFRQHILSAQEQRLLNHFISYYELEDYFDTVTGIDDSFAESKIDAGRQMMAIHGLVPRETIMIGDTVHDHEVAHALGINCVLVSHGHQSSSRLRVTGSPVLDNFFEIEEYLNQNLNWIPGG